MYFELTKTQVILYQVKMMGYVWITLKNFLDNIPKYLSFATIVLEIHFFFDILILVTIDHLSHSNTVIWTICNCRFNLTMIFLQFLYLNTPTIYEAIPIQIS